MTLSAQVDAILVVTRLGIVNRPMLTDLSRELGGSPARKLGFVVTGADVKTGYGAYGYGQMPGSAPETTERQTSAAESPARPGSGRAKRKTPAGR